MKLFPIIGQETFLERIQNLLHSDRLGHSHLFTGPEGAGKDALALQFAAMLNCRGTGKNPVVNVLRATSTATWNTPRFI